MILALTLTRSPDAYHTCYNLAGLSSIQHTYTYDHVNDERDEPLIAAYRWSKKHVVSDDLDPVPAMNPVFVVPWGAAERSREYFQTAEQREVFSA